MPPPNVEGQKLYKQKALAVGRPKALATSVMDAILPTFDHAGRKMEGLQDVIEELRQLNLRSSMLSPIDFPLSAIEMGRIGEYVTDYDAAQGLIALFGISGRFGVASARDLAYLDYRLACQWLIMLTLDIQAARPAQMYCAAVIVDDGDDDDDDECEGAEVCVVASVEGQSDLVMEHCKSQLPYTESNRGAFFFGGRADNNYTTATRGVEIYALFLLIHRLCSY